MIFIKLTASVLGNGQADNLFDLEEAKQTFSTNMLFFTANTVYILSVIVLL